MKDLEIPEHLAVRSVNSLAFAYQKYLAYLKVNQTLDEKLAAGTWVGTKPANNDLIELFVSRSMWFGSYRPLFSKVHEHPTMVKWLEGGPNAPTSLETWGIEKASYMFKDLQIFLNNGGTLDVESDKDQGKRRKDKGKKKANDKGGDKESDKGEKLKKKKAKKMK